MEKTHQAAAWNMYVVEATKETAVFGNFCHTDIHSKSCIPGSLDGGPSQRCVSQRYLDKSDYLLLAPRIPGRQSNIKEDKKNTEYSYK